MSEQRFESRRGGEGDGRRGDGRREDGRRGDGRRGDGRGRGGSRAAARERGREALEGLFQRLGLEITVRTAPPRMGRLVYLLEGDCRRLRRAPKLLGAIQSFTELAAGRGEERRVNCFLDLNGQHTVRRELVKTLALDTADLVEYTGRRVVIEGLTSFERREVHEHLKESEAVETESEGEEPTRYLLISNRS